MKCAIELAKLRNYLLNLNHRDGGPKARFFIAGGFSPERPGELGQALQTHFESNRPSEVMLDKLGCVRIVITAPMQVPDGRTPAVTSVWIIDAPGQLPRLVTAYPAD